MDNFASEVSGHSSQTSPFIDFTFPPTSGNDLEVKDKGKPRRATKQTKEDEKPSDDDFRATIIWKNVILMSGLHIISIYALTRILEYKLFTLLFGVAGYVVSITGVTCGAHRLWTHRAYKAKLPFRILLMFMDCVALQNSIFDWCRDHRTHHKFSETNADPHNARRGFFFCHIGWLLVRKHPDVAKKGRTIFVDDLLKDPVVRFQRKYYVPLAMACCFVIPTLIPWYFVGESLWNAYCISALRYCFSLHVSWCVNSLAHMYGDRPYDKTINPSENHFVNYFALGEGFHNYHHTFPHDYAASEFGIKFNLSTAFIDFMALLGQAYDRRVVSKPAIVSRKQRTGELSELSDSKW